MKLLIIGATGPTGRELVAQAVAQGHQVTTLVRNAAKAGENSGLARGSVPLVDRIEESIPSRDSRASSDKTGIRFAERCARACALHSHRFCSS